MSVHLIVIICTGQCRYCNTRSVLKTDKKADGRATICWSRGVQALGKSSDRSYFSVVQLNNDQFNILFLPMQNLVLGMLQVVLWLDPATRRESYLLKAWLSQIFKKRHYHHNYPYLNIYMNVDNISDPSIFLFDI